MFCDLHTHSTFSDGTKTPSELVDIAIKNGIKAVALTDHNTIDGLNEFISYAAGKDIVAIPGVEISTEYKGTEVHIIGLFIPKSRFNALKRYLELTVKRKEESNIKLIDELNKLGYELDYNVIKNKSSGSINRAVIAAEMLNKGYIASIEEAFQTILSEKNGVYVPPKRIHTLEAIEFLTYISTVPVLAHPLISMDKEQLEEFLPMAKEIGLVGMETMYSEYSDEDTLTAKELACKYGLHESGGSDYHGDNKPKIELGSGLGSLRVPYDVVENLSRNAP